ncbi:contact-dependent growth inhibition system immunity protein [Burkholderia latens]|uniref:CdiI immunity protein domain-containing protein n=1 Tax=Burkholderia latens TaxID=488446 RepID=A0A6H9SLP0_9BURK|nr:contact-dependent growth inhibition system immunity protein [Burkholderia latens]KAB0633354.1 hypothetical protein F7R21_27945 [Burkholderia latens]VWC24092.1 hypothetical protein BLA24064_05971 [Burkholderia latens]
MLSTQRPHMYEIFGAYFNQDFDIWGNTIDEIVKCYKDDSTASDRSELILEIDQFIAEHPRDLESAFYANYNNGFDPVLWGYNAASFLEELKRLLAE